MTQEIKEAYLEEFSDRLGSSLSSGLITKGKQGQSPIMIHRIDRISGPRVGVLKFFSGIQTLELQAALKPEMVAQFVPWRFTGSPQIFAEERAVRVEVAWPKDLGATDVELTSQLPKVPHFTGTWFAGIAETGSLVTLSFSDEAPHYLISGTTGSGKSVAVQTLVYQMIKNSDVWTVLIDGKGGSSLGLFADAPSQFYPMTTNLDPDDIKLVLRSVTQEMNRRYQKITRVKPKDRNEKIDLLDGLLVIVIDEIQELFNDHEILEMVRNLLAQGREALVHLVCTTQYPVGKTLKDPTVRVNLAARVALKTVDARASEVVLGISNPKAHHLLGSGDAYLKVGSHILRSQLGFFSPGTLRALPEEQPLHGFQDMLGDEQQLQHQGFSIAHIACAIKVQQRSGTRADLLREFETRGLPTISKRRMRELNLMATEAVRIIND